MTSKTIGFTPVKLVAITEANDKKYKLVAIFSDESGRLKKVKFGAYGMSDYTIHKDIKRRERYIKRHAVREDWKNPIKRGTLSRYILWGDYNDLQESIEEFKRLFNL